MLQKLLGYAARRCGGILAPALAIALGVMPVQAAPKTHTPADSTALSSLLNTQSGPAGALELGDTIVLNASTTYTAPSGGFILTAVNTGTGYITIQSSALASLPPEGERIQPSDAANMPNIRPPVGSTWAMRTALPPAVPHHFKLVGIEFIGVADNSAQTYPMIEIGTLSSSQNTTALIPHNFIIDRCYFHDNSATQVFHRPIALHGAYVDIINCDFSGVKHNSKETQCIWGVNGSGHYNIINNYLEGAGENIMFGGAVGSIPDVQPENILIQRNYFYKPNSWKDGHPDYDGMNWHVKNHFELKCGKNVTLDSNIFDNCWYDAGSQYGASIVLKTVRINVPGNAQGSAWFTTENITITNNIIRNVGLGFVLAGNEATQGGGFNGMPANVTIRNNLVHDVVRDASGLNTGEMFRYGSGSPNLTVDHNTMFQSGSGSRIAEMWGGLMDNHVHTNNINVRTSTTWRSSVGFSENCFNAFFVNGFVFKKNIIKDAPSAEFLPVYHGDWNPTSLQFPTDWNTVFVNYSNPGTNYAGWKVLGWDQPTNATLYPYNNAGVNPDGSSDGKDIGCDIDAVVAATAGCISGVWSGSPPPSGLIAYDGFDYTGNLNTQNGGSGFANAWTAVSGQGNPALSTGSLTYIGGPNSLDTVGNKLAPSATNQSVRNFTSAINAANSTKWVSFRVKRTVIGSLPTNHVGFPLYPSANGGGTSIFLGKPGGASNWGVDIGGSQSNVSGTANIDAFLLFKLVFTSTQVTASMWVNPSLASESGLGTSHITPLTVNHGGVLSSMKMSTGANSTSYQLDEFRIGNSFADVTPGSPVDVIVDNPAATLTGTWTTSTWTGGGQFYGSNYLHDANTGKGTKTCKWTPSIPATGSYEVFARWTSNGDRANNAPYTVQHAGGTANVPKNQQSQGGTWVSLGTWTFNSGTSGYVQLGNGGTSGYVIADAVRFVKQ